MRDDDIKKNRALICQALGVSEDPKIKTHICKFHNERSPSMTIFENENGAWFFKCFGCGKSGDVFNATMLTQKVGFREAKAWLSNQIGVRIESNKLAPRSELDMPRATDLVRNAHDALMGDPDILGLHMRGYRGIQSTREIERLKVGFLWDTQLYKREWSATLKRAHEKPWINVKRAWVLPITERGELKGIKLHADPIIGVDGKLISKSGALYKIDGKDGRPDKLVKCAWVPLRMTEGGRTTMQTLWPPPEDYDGHDQIFLCGGELKAICVASCGDGIAATAPTSGESVKAKDAGLFGKKKFDDAVVQMYSRLRRFRSVFVNYDDDFAGRKYRDDVMELLAHIGIKATAFAFRMPDHPAPPKIVVSAPENPTGKDCLQVSESCAESIPGGSDSVSIQENDDVERYYCELQNNYADNVRRWCEANDCNESISDFVPSHGYEDPLPVNCTWCAICGSPGIYEGGRTMCWRHTGGKRCLPKYDPPGVWINRGVS